MRHKDESDDDGTFFTACLGRAWASGAEVDLDKLWEGEQRVRVELPTYAWAHKPYFIDPRRVTAIHDSPDLATIEDLERWAWRPFWKPALAEPRAPGEKHTWLVF